MKAYVLPSGEIMHPRRVETPEFIGDGWDFAEPHTAAYVLWKPWAEKASPSVVASAMRMKLAARRKT